MFKLFFMFLASFFCANAFSLTPDYVALNSERFENLIHSPLENVYNSLNTDLPDSNFVSFAEGKIFIFKGHLIWEDQNSVNTTLVDRADLPPDQSLSGFLISPDASMVAYYTTISGQDLKNWNVVNISKKPKSILKKPIVNRMQGFSWTSDSSGLYYSFWNEKADVKLGVKPIIEFRYLDLVTQNDKVIFNPGFAENYGITDLNNGSALIAYRLLADTSGVKTTFSMYKAEKDQKGAVGPWKSIYPRNQYVANFVGTYDDKVLVHSSRVGDTYGIELIDPENSYNSKVLVPAIRGRVLHIAKLFDDKLVLQYHTVLDQDVSIVVYDLKDKDFSKTWIKDLGLSSFGNLGDFNAGPGGTVTRAIFSDVMYGDHVLELDLKTNQLQKLSNLRAIGLGNQDFAQKQMSFTTQDGTLITGRLFYPKFKDPEFVFIRYYGWISIKNTPETKEVQMALKMGGAYFTADMPGGGERGANWFLEGSRNRLKMVGYISETSSMLQNYFNLPKDKIVAMGRSWGGLTSLLLAASYGDNFGVIAPVVPVIDLVDMFENSWFGRISQSDFAPYIDIHGNYILDVDFDNYIESINPVHAIKKMKPGFDLLLLTNGLDDRVDQGGDQEAEFAYALEQSVGQDRFYYHRSVKGNHGNRYYQLLIFAYLNKKYNLKFE